MGRGFLAQTNVASLVVLLTLDLAGEADAGQLCVFGDSYVDTGNNAPEIPDISDYWRPPYGITWPSNPFGRYSDGYIFTDRYATYLNVELPATFRSLNISNRVFMEDGMEVGEAEMLNDKLQHYVDANKTGINFAIAGSAVFPVMNSFAYNVSDQIEKLRCTINMGIVSTQDLANSTALLVVNGNDYYNYVLLHPYLESIEDFIPLVAAEIANDTEELSSFGFKSIAISILGPYGCLPVFTSLNNYSECNDTINSLVARHNSLLTMHISSLQKQLPSSSFQVLDFYNALEEILESGMFKVPLEPCCKGIGGENCGAVNDNNEPQYTVCSNREQYLFWDNFHLTDVGYNALLSKLFSSSQHVSSTRLSHVESM
eukprot:c13812_g1_i1 orf=69-1184(-)